MAKPIWVEREQLCSGNSSVSVCVIWSSSVICVFLCSSACIWRSFIPTLNLSFSGQELKTNKASNLFMPCRNISPPDLFLISHWLLVFSHRCKTSFMTWGVRWTDRNNWTHCGFLESVGMLSNLSWIAKRLWGNTASDPKPSVFFLTDAAVWKTVLLPQGCCMTEEEKEVFV